MGVYIKGMEMPIDCLHCCFASGCSYCEGYNDHCVFEPDDIKTDWDFDHGVFPESIPDWCPLVHVPPHGDLIDRDVLLKKCEFACTDDDEDVRVVRYSAIESAPTIIPAEGVNNDD